MIKGVGQLLVGFINVVMILIITKEGDSRYTTKVQEICLDSLSVVAREEMWAEWSHGGMSNTIPTRM